MTDLARRIAALDPARRRLLEERLRREGGLPAGHERIPRLPDAPFYSLSFGQQRLWFVDQLIAGSPAYNIPFAGRLEGPLDPAALQRAVTEVVRRHEILRTTFPTVDGRAVQRVGAECDVPLGLDDLTRTPAPSRDEEAQRIVNEEARVPFDLARGPVLRVRLLRLEAEDHMILVTMPHIVTDAWSTAVFFRELPALYDAFAEGRPSPLPELPIQFRDYAAWQREQLSGERLDRLLRYWTGKLAGAPTVLELPTDRPRPHAQTFQGARATVDLPRPTTRALEAIAQREGATPFMAYLAAFDILLHGWSGQDDLLVGSPVATREQEETHGLIGFFINTLVFRTKLAGNPTYRALLRQVRETCLEAYAHQDLPFERLVETLGLERDLSRAPLTQATLVLQNVHIPSPEFRRLRLTHFQQTGSRTAKFDLMLGLWESAEGVEGWWEYNTDLFEPETIARLSARFRTLLQEIVADPNRPIRELLLLPEEERRCIEAWSATATPYPRDLGVKELFERRAAAAPDAVALSSGAARRSYGEVNRSANRLAHYLRGLGVRAEERVGVLLPRSFDAVEALLGVVKAGGAYVPLDPGDPPARLGALLAETGARWVVTDTSHAARLAAARVGLVYLDRDGVSIAAESNTDPPWWTVPEQLAYVMFTSGSTGTPKGVAVPHRAVVRLVFGQTYAAFERDEVFLLMAPLAFDASTFEIWGALLHGARLVIYPDETPTPARLTEVIVREGVTTLWLTAGLFHLLMDELPDLFRPLRRVLAGGDVLSPPHVRRALESRAGLVLVNGYGPTEGTTFTCCHVMRAPEEVRMPIPIGTPLENTRVVVLDGYGNLAPIGVPGELAIGGDGLARGYDARPAWTAERFVPDPFAAEPGGRLYRTGDIVRWLPGGALDFLGRRDRQVKVRGYRVELPEIEAALVAQPAVRDAAVEIHTDDRGVKRLVAYVVPEADAGRDPAALVDALRDRLPDSMIPHHLEFLDAFPLTPNGKLDRRALPAPSRSPGSARADSEEPPGRNGIEAKLALIWAEALGLERVGLHDDFFALGGDSIQAILVLARAHEAGITLTPRQLFERPTISGLAAVAAARRDRPAEQGPVTGALPATPIQRWFFELGIPDPSRWNMGLVLTARAPLDREALARALDALLEHHDALRLRAHRDESGWRLGLEAPGAPAALRVFEAGESLGSTPGEALERVTAELHGALDLERGPLLGAALVRGVGADTLVLIVHHLAVDAVSWRILLEDLERGYTQARRGEPIALPPKTTSMKAWAERLEAYARSDAARTELGYWLSLEAAAAPVLALPLDDPSASDFEAGSRDVRTLLDRDATHALLHEATNAYRNEPVDLLLAALVEALAGRGGERVARVDVERHGREPLFEDLDLTCTVGWFTTIVPVRLDLRETSKDPGATLRAVKERLRGIPGGGIGYGLLRWLGAPEDAERLARLPRAPVCFNYLGVVDATLRRATLFSEARMAGGPARDPGAPRAYPLEITAWVLDGELHVAFVHGAGHRRETVERLAADFTSALRALLAHACAPGAGGVTPSDFPRAKVSQEDLDRLLARIGASGGGGDAR